MALVLARFVVAEVTEVDIVGIVRMAVVVVAAEVAVGMVRKVS